MKHKFNFSNRVSIGSIAVVDTPVSKRSQVSNKCRSTVGRLSALFFALFLCVGQMWGRLFYLNTNSHTYWEQENAHFVAAYTLTSDQNTWIITDAAVSIAEHVFCTTIPDENIGKIRFRRVNPNNHDNTWNSSTDYTFDASKNCIRITEWDNSSSYETYTYSLPAEMYIVGGAVEGGWGNFKKFEFISPGVYRWEGKLTANGGDNSCFKFAPQNSYNNEYRAEVNNKEVVLGTAYKLVRGGDDRKFKITATGTYVITIDLTNPLNQKMTVTLPVVDYYIKHPWNGGEWSWEKLTDNGDGTYSLTNNYGDDGCNWNTKADDDGKRWIERANLSLVGSPAKGDECTFTLNPSAGTITITKNAAPATEYYVFGAGGTNWVTGWTKKVAEYKLTENDGVYSKTFYNVKGSGLEFKICDQNGSEYQWDKFSQAKSNFTCRQNDTNINFDTKGTKSYEQYWDVTVYFDGINIWVTRQLSELGFSSNEFYVMGSGNSWTWDKNTKNDYNHLVKNGGVASATFAVSGNWSFKVFRASDQYEINWDYYNASKSTGTLMMNNGDDNIGRDISDKQLTIYFDGKEIWTDLSDPAPKVNVTFETFCAQTVPSQSVAVGGKATSPSNLSTIQTQSGSHEVATFGGWYADAACTQSFDFNNTTINDNTTIYAKWQMRSEDFYEVGDVWMADDNSNWRNGRNPKFTKSTDNRSMSVTYIAPKGLNRFEVIRGNDWGYKVPMDVDPNSPIQINVADGHMNFNLNKVQEVTITYNGRFSVSARDYTPHFVSGKYISGNNWGKINGEAMKEWNGEKYSNQMLTEEDGKAVIIVTEVPAGQHQFKITGTSGDNCVIGMERFNALYVDLENKPDDLSWNNTQGTSIFGYELPITDQKQRDITFSLSQQMDLKITFDGGKITISEPDTKTVTFDTKGGSSIDPVQVTKGGKLSAAPANPTKTDYCFMGWSETDGGSVVDVTTVTINDDKTFYAIWHQFTMQVVVDGSSATVTPTLPAHHGALTFCYTLLDNSDQPLAEQPEITVNTTTGAATFTFTSDAKKVQCKVHDGADCNAELIATMTQSVGRNIPTNIAIHIDTDKWGRTTGQSFTLTVTGNNIDDDATYQWYRNSTAVVGATASTYVVASCTKDHAGEYKCVVSNGDKSAENVDKHTLKVYSLLITVNGENNYYDFVHTSGDEGQVSVFLEGSWTYEMKIYDNSGGDGYYGNDGTMTGQYCTDFAFDKTKSNCKIKTSMGGDYLFTVKYGNDNYPSLSATYPLANQPSGKTIYFVNSQNWDKLHYRIGHNTNSAAQALTKVPGTDKLYKVVTNEYNSVDAWSIANNAGWTGNERTIYQPYKEGDVIKPNDGYAITRQTTFQKYIVSTPITLNPSSYSNTDNECDYWHVDKTDGMLSHKVTISDYAHGTVTVAYTDVDDHAQNMTSGNADLAHTCILTISCASAQGYHVTSFKVNGENFASGSQIILTEDITITATIDPNPNTPYTVNHKQQNANDDGYTLAETDNLTGTTDSKVTPDRKSYEGFDAPAGQQVTINGDGTTVVDYNYTRKVYDVTYTDQGEGWTYGAKPESAKYDATVNFVVTPETGYEVTVSSPDVTIIQSGTDYSFTMPNKVVSVTVSAEFTAELTLEATPAIAAPNAQVTATPNLTNFPTDIMICYTLYKGSVDDANKVDVEFSINKTDHKGQATFTAPDENGTYIVKADVHRGNDCSTETILSSAEATITVKPLTNTFTNGAGDNKWSTVGNWSENMLPDAEMDVTIRAKVIVDIPTAAANSIVIDDFGHDAEIEILSTGGLQVEGTITRTTDGKTYGPTTIHDLYIHSDAFGTGALVFDNSEGNAQAYVEMYSKANIVDKTKNWQYMGTPFNDVTNAANNYYGSYLFVWDVAKQNWVTVKNGGSMSAFAGYCISQANQTTYVMSGTLASTANKEIILGKGDNVIGNSWTAPINVDQFVDDDFKGNITKTIYMFNTGVDANKTYNEGDAPGTYIAIPINMAEYVKELRVIPAMAGYFVTSSDVTGTLMLNYDRLTRTTPLSNEPMRAPNRANRDVKPDIMSIKVTGEYFSDKLYLAEREDFAEEFDNGWDAEKWPNDAYAPELYASTTAGDQAVSALPELEGTLLGFRAGGENAYTISFQYDGDKTYYLNDLIEEKSTLIRDDQTYFFLVGGNDITHRFQISTTPFESYIGTGSDNIGNGVQKAVKFIENDKLFILHNSRLYDGTGKALKPGK